MSSSNTVAICPRTLCGHEPFRAELGSRAWNLRWNDGGKRLSGTDLIAFLQGADRVVVGVERLDAATIARLPSLRVVAKFGVGLDNLDLDALEAAGVKVGWTPGVNRRAVAELVVAGALALLRGLVEGDRQIRSGALAAGTWRAMPGRQLSEQHVGVVGCGHVGLEVARLMRALGAGVSVCDVRDRREWIEPLGIRQVELEELCREADILTLHACLDESSRGLLGAAQLGWLRPGAIVINTARGELVDELALLDALDSGQVSGAFLDVLREEPAAPSPLVSHARVLVSAHVGGSTDHAIVAMADAALHNLEHALPVSTLRERLRAGRIENART
jgi:D-3-phosphoglycerate dehydrogenase